MNAQDFIAALAKHKGKVTAALAANAALFGIDVTAEANALVSQIVDVAVYAVDAYAALAVVVSAFVEALKSDPDVDTGPTTPGPVDYSQPE